jgi:hypothetical protein
MGNYDSSIVILSDEVTGRGWTRMGRLALGKGEGRVRVCLKNWHVRAANPSP